MVCRLHQRSDRQQEQAMKKQEERREAARQIEERQRKPGKDRQQPVEGDIAQSQGHGARTGRKP
jgi:hypothetical protein